MSTNPITAGRTAVKLAEALPRPDRARYYTHLDTNRAFIMNGGLSGAHVAPIIADPSDRTFTRFSHARFFEQLRAVPGAGDRFHLLQVDRHLAEVAYEQGPLTLASANTVSTLQRGKIELDSNHASRVRVLDILSALLKGSDYELALAVQTVGHTKDPELISWIKPYLKHSNRSLRALALFSLASIGYTNITACLLYTSDAADES